MSLIRMQAGNIYSSLLLLREYSWISEFTFYFIWLWNEFEIEFNSL